MKLMLSEIGLIGLKLGEMSTAETDGRINGADVETEI